MHIKMHYLSVISAQICPLLHPHRGCLLLRSCHLAGSRVWWRGDSMTGLREATQLQSSVSFFYHPALSVSRLPNYLLLNSSSVSQVCWCSLSSPDAAATPLDVRNVVGVRVKNFYWVGFWLITADFGWIYISVLLIHSLFHMLVHPREVGVWI